MSPVYSFKTDLSHKIKIIVKQKLRIFFFLNQSCSNQLTLKKKKKSYIKRWKSTLGSLNKP